MGALRLCLERLLPPRRDRLVTFELSSSKRQTMLSRRSRRLFMPARRRTVAQRGRGLHGHRLDLYPYARSDRNRGRARCIEGKDAEIMNTRRLRARLDRLIRTCPTVRRRFRCYRRPDLGKSITGRCGALVRIAKQKARRCRQVGRELLLRARIVERATTVGRTTGL